MKVSHVTDALGGLHYSGNPDVWVRTKDSDGWVTYAKVGNVYIDSEGDVVISGDDEDEDM